jgi:hypothetical protein
MVDYESGAIAWLAWLELRTREALGLGAGLLHLNQVIERGEPDKGPRESTCVGFSAAVY